MFFDLVSSYALYQSIALLCFGGLTIKYMESIFPHHFGILHRILLACSQSCICGNLLYNSPTRVLLRNTRSRQVNILYSENRNKQTCWR